MASKHGIIILKVNTLVSRVSCLHHALGYSSIANVFLQLAVSRHALELRSSILALCRHYANGNILRHECQGIVGGHVLQSLLDGVIPAVNQGRLGTDDGHWTVAGYSGGDPGRFLHQCFPRIAQYSGGGHQSHLLCGRSIKIVARVAVLSYQAIVASDVGQSLESPNVGRQSNLDLANGKNTLQRAQSNVATTRQINTRSNAVAVYTTNDGNGTFLDRRKAMLHVPNLWQKGESLSCWVHHP